MRLLNFWYECKNCKVTFKSPRLGCTYGEFLLMNQTCEIAYLDAISCDEYIEFSDLLKDNKRLEVIHINENQGVEVLQTMFGLICDQSDKNNYYSIRHRPKCPCCGQTKYSHWGPTNPPDIVDVDVKNLTFTKWNRLTNDEKKQLVDQAVGMYFNLHQDSEDSEMQV